MHILLRKYTCSVGYSLVAGVRAARHQYTSPSSNLNTASSLKKPPSTHTAGRQYTHPPRQPYTVVTSLLYSGPVLRALINDGSQRGPPHCSSFSSYSYVSPASSARILCYYTRSSNPSAASGREQFAPASFCRKLDWPGGADARASSVKLGVALPSYLPSSPRRSAQACQLAVSARLADAPWNGAGRCPS